MSRLALLLAGLLLGAVVLLNGYLLQLPATDDAPPTVSTRVSDPPALTLTSANDGTTVRVSRDELLAIRLAENRTTAYRWAVEPLDTTVVALQESTYAGARDKAIGAAGAVTLTFKALQPGTTQIRLKHQQGSDGPIAGQFSVTVEVDE
jgi:predicted secreted protein